MAYHPAYGTEHQRTRAALMANLRKYPGQRCPICRQPMFADQPIDLGHLSQADKQAGRGGRVLQHAKCNRGEYSAKVNRNRIRIVEPAGETKGCHHLETMREELPAWACPCDRPLEHEAEINERRRADPDYYATESHTIPCHICGLYGSGRIW